MDQKTGNKMSIANVEGGRNDTAYRLLFYGPEGVGKSSFLADCPGAVFLDLEEGTSFLDVQRFPTPMNFADIVDAVASLESDDHKFSTLVIDTADRLESFIWQHVCSQGNKKSIEDFGYGKGYVIALGIWRELLTRLDALRKSRGMNIAFLGHAVIKTYKNPEGEDWDRYQFRLHDKAAGFLKEWVDVVGFCQYEQIHKTDSSGKNKGFSTGARVLHLQRTAAFDAKSRWPIPVRMPLDWSAFKESMANGARESMPQMIEKISELLNDLSEADQKNVVEWKAKAKNDPVKVAKLLNWVRGKIPNQETRSEAQ